MPIQTNAKRSVKYTDEEVSELIARDMITRGLLVKGDSVSGVKVMFRPGRPGEGMQQVFQGFEYEITSKQ